MGEPGVSSGAFSKSLPWCGFGYLGERIYLKTKIIKTKAEELYRSIMGGSNRKVHFD